MTISDPYADNSRAEAEQMLAAGREHDRAVEFAILREQRRRETLAQIKQQQEDENE